MTREVHLEIRSWRDEQVSAEEGNVLSRASREYRLQALSSLPMRLH